MTGLDLESFLLLLRADLTTWVVLGLATLGLALLVWSCWRVTACATQLSRALAGGSSRIGLVRQHDPRGDVDAGPGSPRCRESGPHPPDSGRAAGRVEIRRAERTAIGRIRSRSRSSTERWDLAAAPLKLADASLRVARPRRRRSADGGSRHRDQASSTDSRSPAPRPKGKEQPRRHPLSRAPSRSRGITATLPSSAESAASGPG